MFKLLSLLSATLFLVLLIGGEDRGQARLGLQNHYAPPEPVPMVIAETPVASSDVVLATYAAPVPEPVALPALQPASEIAPTTVALEQPAAALPETQVIETDVRFVNSAAINVRQGPSTNEAVIGRLTRNEAVTVVADNGDGWLLVRIEGDGVEGYVAGRLLTDRAP